nr:uncharacterized protein DKFZp434B061-like [Aegilops tauschii subsp. strangulata]
MTFVREPSTYAGDGVFNTPSPNRSSRRHLLHRPRTSRSAANAQARATRRPCPDHATADHHPDKEPPRNLTADSRQPTHLRASGRQIPDPAAPGQRPPTARAPSNTASHRSEPPPDPPRPQHRRRPNITPDEQGRRRAPRPPPALPDQI